MTEKSEGQNRTRRIQVLVRMNDDEREQLERLADALKASIRETISRLVQAEANRRGIA